MAEITNKVKKIDRRKDLYEHVSFDELYEYNQVILNIREISRKLFTNYISEGTRYWRDVLKQKEYLGTDFGLYRGDTENEIYTIKMTDLKEDQNEEDGPQTISFSLIEIVEPFDILYEKESKGVSPTKELEKFIDLGLYPIVVSPMRESELYDSFEKYDDVVHGFSTIGTIVDIHQFNDADMNTHYVATIMWNPNYIDDMTREMILSKNGYLVMRNLLRTPKVWREPNESLMTNFGIPVYEYQSMRATLATINYVDSFVSYINEAVVTGHLDLDFVKAALNMANATAEKMSQQVVISGGAKWQKGLNPAPSIPVIDASEDDAFGHRLHLYDEPVVPDTDDDDFEIG